eukprot:TRINITY_DN5005_c0_g4_i3.p1 TRINITY_DN5005_c0_g4~~TRINITY_DN5005_c0_g4_i3.p1  ORF type:complete len:237 (+),score=32.76 TRINITY_DN5005_c0_g4_i3:91-801(+)
MAMDSISDILKSHKAGSAFSDANKAVVIGASAFLCVYGVMMLWGEAFWNWNRQKLCFDVKSVLSITVYRKFLVKKDYAAKHIRNGEENELPDLNNVMVTDIEEIINLIQGICETCALIFECSSYLYMLYAKIGKDILLPISVLLLMSGLNYYLSTKNEVYFAEMVARKDERLSLTRDVAYGMKALKFMGWERFFRDRLQSLRWKEFVQLRNLRYLNIGFTFIWSTTSVLLLSLIHI